ncbi:MAG: hypothetical protein J6C46_08625 [Clostridia bacterium]|nr:hypothetical protein [Clostridia bacterium]
MDKEVSFKFSNKIENLNKLEKYSKLLSQIQSISKSIDKGTVKEISEGAKNVSSLNQEASKTDSILSKAFSLGKITAFVSGLKSAVKTIGSLTNKSSAYTENLNLYAVAFDGATESADKFVNKLTEMYGLDESWLVRTTGIFKQLSNAMALSTEQGTKLATLMTQMSVDISSLYNIDIERASSVLQSSLAGQTKPIRGATGGDITQNTLQLTLDKLGIDRYIGDLSFAEKRLVIIISLTQQLTKATNDFGKTIESPANQMRILNEQWERLTRAVGNLFLPILSKVLPYLNAIMMVLTEIINTIASFLGFNIEEFDYGVSGVTDSVLDLEDSLNGATSSASKLKKEMSGLRNFDKLNVIRTPSSSKVSGSAGGGIDPKIMDAFNNAFDEYNRKLKDVNMKANKIRDSIMEWLGFTKEINEETGEINWKFERITGGTILGALGVGGFIYSGVSKIFKLLNKIGLLKFASLDKFKNLKIIETIKSSKVISSLTSLGETFSIIAGIIAYAFAQIYSFNAEWDRLKEAIENNNLEEYFKIDSLGELITKLFTLTGLMQGGVIPFLTIGAKKFGLLDGAIETAKETIKDIKETFTDFKDQIVEDLKEIYDENIKPIVDEIKRGYDEKIAPILEKIPYKLKDIIISSGLLKSSFTVLAGVVGGIFSSTFTIAFGLIGNTVSSVFDVIKLKIDGFKTSIKGVINIIKGLKDGDWGLVWEGMKQVVIGAFKGMVEPIKVPINSIIGFAETMANAVISGINSVIKALNKINIEIPDWVPKYGGKDFGFDIKTMKKVEFKRLKQGLEYVPSDYYGPVFLDHGERVLTKQENIEYNQNKFYTENTKSNILEKQNIKPLNATFVINVGSKKIAEQVLTDLEDMAKSNGKPITING